MTFKDMLSMSIGNLWRRKLRTFLTVLGVLIGTISIVAMLSIALGMKAMIVDEFSSYGSATQVTVYSNGDGGSGGANTGVEYMTGDTSLENIKQVDHVVAVYPIINGSATIKQSRYETWTSLNAIPRELMEKLDLAEGELPESGTADLQFICGNSIPADFYYRKGDEYIYPYYENNELPDVDLFSSNLQLFMYNDNAYIPETTGDEDSVISDGGNYDDPYQVKIRGKFTGLMAGEVNEYKNEYSYGITCDIETYKNYLKKNFKKGYMPGQCKDANGKVLNEWIYSNFIVEVDESSNVDTVQQTIQDMGFSASSNKELLDSAQGTVKIIELVLGGIGMIAFLVAAIGIANTMMMSTYERTKEIGVMKVLGCDMKDIMGLFLAEAGFIGFLGGTVGAIVTKIISMVVNAFLGGAIGEAMFGISSGSVSIVPIWLIGVAIVFSTFMGMVAGFFPARRAMKLSPLAAIRNE